MNLSGDKSFFKEDELACPCCGACKMDGELMARLIKFRVAWAKPMYVTSGFRCMAHNAKIGSEPTSKHVTGQAVDVSVIGSERYAFIRLAFKMGFNGIGIAKTFIHLDSREKPAACWLY